MENKSLEGLVATRLSIFESLVEGELNDEIEAMLNDLDVSQAKKIDSYYYRLAELEASEAKIKQIKEQFDNALKRAKDYQEKLKNRLKKIAQDLDLKEIEGEKFKFTFGKSKPKMVINEACHDDLLAQYGKQKVVIELDKDAIKQAIDMGFEVDGVSFEGGLSIKAKVR